MQCRYIMSKLEIPIVSRKSFVTFKLKSSKAKFGRLIIVIINYRFWILVLIKSPQSILRLRMRIYYNRIRSEFIQMYKIRVYYLLNKSQFSLCIYFVYKYIDQWEKAWRFLSNQCTIEFPVQILCSMNGDIPTTRGNYRYGIGFLLECYWNAITCVPRWHTRMPLDATRQVMMSRSPGIVLGQVILLVGSRVVVLEQYWNCTGTLLECYCTIVDTNVHRLERYY